MTDKDVISPDDDDRRIAGFLLSIQSAPLNSAALGDREASTIKVLLWMWFDLAKRLKQNMPAVGHIHVAVVEGNQFNAKAGFYKDQGMVLINYPAVTILSTLFWMALRNPSFWSEIGDPSRDDPDEPRDPIAPTMDSLWNNGRLIPDTLCPVRCQFAILMSQLSMMFLALHEAAHIFNGHVDWLVKQNQRRGNNRKFYEERDTPSPTHSLKLQSLEWQADGDAALLFFNLLHLAQIDTLPGIREPLSKNEGVVRLYDRNLLRFPHIRDESNTGQAGGVL